MKGIFYIIGLSALCLPLWAGENIVLNTGFSLSADRHEIVGDTIRIYSASGVAEIPARLVASVETVDTPSVVPEPAAPVAADARAAAAPVPADARASAAIPSPAKPTPLELAQAAARKYLLPDAFVAGVMRAESGFNEAAVSPKGAIGLMQLMPDTARDLGVDPARPDENSDAGARYLRDLLVKYEDRPDQVVLALAAYNAGPAAVDKYHGVPPYRETREYILRVLKDWNPSK